MSYVTGAHNMKFGYQGGLAIDDQQDFSGDQQLTYTFRAGVPISFNHADRPVAGGQPDRVVRPLRTGSVDARAG